MLILPTYKLLVAFKFPPSRKPPANAFMAGRTLSKKRKALLNDNEKSQDIDKFLEGQGSIGRGYLQAMWT